MRFFHQPILLILPFHCSPFLRSSALDYPLSDTSVRSAYFLGQRYKASSAEFLGPYTKYLPAPKQARTSKTFSSLHPSLNSFVSNSRRVEVTAHSKPNSITPARIEKRHLHRQNSSDAHLFTHTFAERNVRVER